MSIAFYLKARPQNADAVLFYRDLSRVFIGYPAWRKDLAPGTPIGDCIHRLDDPSWDNPASVAWEGLSSRRGYQSIITAQRNLVKRIDVGSFAVVPYLSEGIAYIARISHPYDVEKSPAWDETYLTLRLRQGLPHTKDDYESLVGDVVQGWRTEQWKPISFAALPRWLSSQIMGRRTLGELKGRIGSRTAFAAIQELYNGSRGIPWNTTTDLQTIQERLLDVLTPSSFENLCVHLLQLEEPEHRWQHVGGSGDGGVDGLGFDSHGQCVGALQCKLQAHLGLVDDIRFMRSTTAVRRIVASLLHPDGALNNIPSGVEFWSGRDIARRVLANAQRLPLALTLRVGSDKE